MAQPAQTTSRHVVEIDTRSAVRKLKLIQKLAREATAELAALAEQYDDLRERTNALGIRLVVEDTDV